MVTGFQMVNWLIWLPQVSVWSDMPHSSLIWQYNFFPGLRPATNVTPLIFLPIKITPTISHNKIRPLCHHQCDPIDIFAKKITPTISDNKIRPFCHHQYNTKIPLKMSSNDWTLKDPPLNDVFLPKKTTPKTNSHEFSTKILLLLNFHSVPVTDHRWRFLPQQILLKILLNFHSVPVTDYRWRYYSQQEQELLVVLGLVLVVVGWGILHTLYTDRQ